MRKHKKRKADIIVLNEKGESRAWRGRTKVRFGKQPSHFWIFDFLSPNRNDRTEVWFAFREHISGLSRNHLFQLWERNQFGDRTKPILKLQRTPSATLAINLRLTGAPAEFDPILVTIGKVSEALGVSRSALLRNLYRDLLEQNGLDADEAHPSSIKTWKPYGWPKDRPISPMKSTPTSFKSFHFLKEGKFKEKKSSAELTVRFTKGEQFEIARKKLPLVCQWLTCHSYSDFFKLLYMSFLRLHKIVDEQACLYEDWESRLRQIHLENMHLVFPPRMPPR